MKGKSGKASVKSVLWGLFLWVVMPPALYFAGFLFLGPNIGVMPGLEQSVEKIDNLVSARGEPESTGAPTAEVADDPNSTPQIDIDVQKSERQVQAPDRQSEQPRRKRRKRTTTKPAPTAQARDEASGDAAMPSDQSPPPTGEG